MKTILITGINGFLGSNLAKRFSNNYNIIGTEFTKENLFRIKEDNFPIYLSDKNGIEQLFAENKIDIIIHTATFYGRSNEDFTKLFEANLSYPFYLHDIAAKNKVELFVNTDSALERYTSAYSLTKKQFLDWLKFRCNEIKVVNMQLEHFYGPGASQTNFIISMINKLFENESQIDLTKGEQKRDFVYYEDVLDAYELVISYTDILNNSFQHFEIGTGELISIKDLMILLRELTMSKSNLNFGAIPYRENELMESQTDNSNICKLGWQPRTIIREGLLKTIIGIKK